MASCPITSWKIDGEKVATVEDFIFLGTKITLDSDCSHEIKRCCSLEEKLWPTYTAYWKAETSLCQQGWYNQSYGLFSSHVWMWELGHKEDWVPKNWFFQIMFLEKALESPLDCKEIQPVDPKGDQSWIFTGKTDAEVEALIFGHLMRRADSLEKILMLRKIQDRRRRGRQSMG